MFLYYYLTNRNNRIKTDALPVLLKIQKILIFIDNMGFNLVRSITNHVLNSYEFIKKSFRKHMKKNSLQLNNK